VNSLGHILTTVVYVSVEEHAAFIASSFTCCWHVNSLGHILTTVVYVSVEEHAAKLWTGSESLTSDMAISFESLRSMCSDREQV